MRILIIGAGLTGCTLARLMTNRGHSVVIKEKEDHIGGLCYTKKSPNGLLYEPFGGHAFHTKENRIRNFVLSFSEFNNYTHRKGIYINGKLRHFPLSMETIHKMRDSKQIIKELEERPLKPDFSNLERYSISQFGKTLYKLFIHNYSKKMWGIEPKELTPEYIQNRIKLKESNEKLFEDNFQGLPINGYTEFLNNMIKGIPLELKSTDFNESQHDLILYSGRIDELFKFRRGSLEHRSLNFEYVENEKWEHPYYGSINLPEHAKYIRKVNFKIYYQSQSDKNWIQYQEPVPFNKKFVPLYPIYTKRNIELFDIYLLEACKSEIIIPVGRLGLYKYLEMTQAISLAMNMIPLIEKWKILRPKNRYFEIRKLLNK